jgi:hypothetical protein
LTGTAFALFGQRPRLHQRNDRISDNHEELFPNTKKRLSKQRLEQLGDEMKERREAIKEKV